MGGQRLASGISEIEALARELEWCPPWSRTRHRQLLDRYRSLLLLYPQAEHSAWLENFETGKCHPHPRNAQPPTAQAGKIQEAVAARVSQVKETLSALGHTDLALDIEGLLRCFHRQQPPQRTLKELPRLLRQYRNQGLDIHCMLEPWPISIAAYPSQVAYEIIAEALQNAYKHGHPRGVRVKLQHLDGILKIEVSNRILAASQTEGSKLGLGHLRWRVRSCKGRMRLESGAGNRMRLRVQLPVS